MKLTSIRKTIKTYSRQKKRSLYDEEEPPIKRACVEATVETEEATESILLPTKSPAISRDSSALPSSSLKQCAPIFSDDAPQSSPPSSPTPQNMSPPMRKRRPVFAFLKRKAKTESPAKEPLSESIRNAVSPSKKSPQRKKKRLVQTQLDLVSEFTKTCKVCGMDYVPSHAEDAALHRKFHAMNVGGIDIPKSLSEKLRSNQVWSGGDGSFIAVVSRRDMPALRNKAIQVLQVVNSELGAVPVSDEALWSQLRNPIAKARHPSGESPEQATKGTVEYMVSDRFKTYVYIRGQKCVGACLAERIQEAFAVVDQDDASGPGSQSVADSPSSCVSIANTPNAAMLGISRIWVSSLHRKHGIARRLLDSARSNFFYGMTVDKTKVAFSQPTESGGQLARKWFNRRAGWLVYMDQ